jgi:RimJ/RimL family protein N-acetyltransferase
MEQGDLLATWHPQLRMLGCGDLPHIEMHLLSLDMASRNSRFGCGFGDWAVTGYARGLDVSTDILFGAVEFDTDRIVGLAEARPAKAPQTVDLGVSVLASHRKRGLAHELVARAVHVAFDRDVKAIELTFAPSNVAAGRIAAKLGATFKAPGFAIVRRRPKSEQRHDRGSS